MRCSIVDVFAEKPFAGNQLAVVRDCAHLDGDVMQDIAREMNFSETTFVVDEREHDARVRIFTPAAELPFAGHPTIGTAWVLGRDRGAYALDLDAGKVPVTFGDDGIVWMQPPEVDLGAMFDASTAAALLHLSAGDIDTAYPCRHAVVGPHFVLIGVSTLDALRRAWIDPDVHASVAAGEFIGVFAFAAEAYSADADFAARMYFDANGFREDPATGSANTAFAAYLRDLGNSGDVVVEQGFEIKRPSRLYLDVGDVIRVGGKVQPVLTGSIETSP